MVGFVEYLHPPLLFEPFFSDHFTSSADVGVDDEANTCWEGKDNILFFAADIDDAATLPVAVEVEVHRAAGAEEIDEFEFGVVAGELAVELTKAPFIVESVKDGVIAGEIEFDLFFALGVDIDVFEVGKVAREVVVIDAGAHFARRVGARSTIGTVIDSKES